MNKEKIGKILRKDTSYFSTHATMEEAKEKGGSSGVIIHDMNKKIDELYTLIQEERKEAVRGFVDKIRNEMGGKQFGTNPKDEKKEEAMHISYNWAISDMVRLLETYLQSLDKGDTDDR